MEAMEVGWAVVEKREGAGGDAEGAAPGREVGLMDEEGFVGAAEVVGVRGTGFAGEAGSVGAVG
ncbi:hypothetical protein [Actinoplanes sp. URMC 104]|uniref:hypothetical protein n=1 Tax=Actinoplanes sp. URMC 104 TaxID=3423409 RepID=UPI003F199755